MLSLWSNILIRFAAYLCVLFLLPVQALSAQEVLKGKLIDYESKKGIAYARVFVPNTQIGALTNEIGEFELLDIPAGSFEILAHKIGYETLQKKIDCMDPKSCLGLRLHLHTETKSIALEDVNISAKKSRAWYKRFRQFRKGFLGTSKQAARCEILNPEVLDLQESPAGDLQVKAHDLIEIKNPSTGYQLSFALDHFTMQRQAISYGGKPFFKELPASSKKEAHTWNKRRVKTYMGSMQHFLRALVQGNLEAEGFEIYQATLNSTKTAFVQGKALGPADILVKNPANGALALSLHDFLQIVYTREVDNRPMAAPSVGGLNQQMARDGEKSYIDKSFDPAGSHGRNQVSYLYSLSPQVQIYPDGVIARPKLIKEYGYWAWEKVAEMLPKEYLPPAIKQEKAVALVQKDEKEKPEQNMNHPERNGFILKDLKIPLNEIKSGGPPKDGIPAIDHPRFIQIEEVDFLKEADQVMSVSYRGITKAYPLKIMDQHEIVNDVFDGVAVSVTYCPLCGSGLSFLGQVEGRKKTFGVSGLLYNSDVLLYDRETESLWSQIMSESISGKESGAKLAFVPTRIMTWEAWKKNYPQSSVLSTQTGFYKSYEKSAYTDYRKSEGLMFPISKQSARVPLKSWVLGIEIKGKAKAYPFSELAKSPGKIKDMIEGVELIIQYNTDMRTVQVDLEGIPNSKAKILTLYWFAWYAFHPETTVFRWKRHKQ